MHKNLLAGLLLSLMLLGGCSTLPSADNIFEDAKEVETGLDDVQAAVPLEEAINNTQSDMLEKFWFRAHIANNIGKRRLTHMTLNGIVEKPYGYYMNNSFLAEPYEYYRWKDKTFVRQNNNWFHGREPHLPFDVSYGFDEWIPYIGRAEVTGVDEVLSIPTIVHQIELTGAELLKLDSPVMESLKEEDLQRVSPLLEQSNLRVLFYVGDTSQSTEEREVLPIIYKYQIWIQMPIPDAGYMEQEVVHFIFRVNEETVEMPDIEQIEKFVIEIEEVREQYEQEMEELEEELEK